MEGHMKTVQKGFWGRMFRMRSRFFLSSRTSLPISGNSKPYTTFKIWRTTTYFSLKINMYLMEGHMRTVQKGFWARMFCMRSKIFQSSHISVQISGYSHPSPTLDIWRTTPYFFLKINTYLLEGHMRTVLTGFWGRMFGMRSKIC